MCKGSEAQGSMAFSGSGMEVGSERQDVGLEACVSYLGAPTTPQSAPALVHMPQPGGPAFLKTVSLLNFLLPRHPCQSSY